MKKALEYAEILSAECAELIKGKSFEITFREAGKKEGLSTSYSGNRLTLKARDPCSGIFGIRQLSLGFTSGCLAEHMGCIEPKFSLRPLWIGCDQDIVLTSSCSLAVPRYLAEDIQNTHKLCQRILELGFNGICLGVREGQPSKPIAIDHLQVFRIFRDYGLKIILKPSFSNPSEISCRHLENLNLPIDYLFWEINTWKDERDRKFTEAEKAIHEVRRAESLGYPLIYYVSAWDTVSTQKQAEWMADLCDEMGKKTVLAFPAVSGPLTADHSIIHPFWEKLRLSPDVSGTPLLPISNFGMISQGEGLWPCVAFDLIERYIPRCERHYFTGIMGLVNQLPRREGLLDCSLWCTSRALWGISSSSLSLEMWLKAQGFIVDIRVLYKIREIAIDLSYLRSLTTEKSRDQMTPEECKVLTESLLARLKEMQFELEFEERKGVKKSGKPTIYDYFILFDRDARRIILHFLQCFNVSLSNVLGNEDVNESFWTQLAGGGGQGVRSGAKVGFLETPRRGMPGSKMEQIFLNNRLF